MSLALETPIPLQPPPPRVKRWTKEEYYQVIEKGAFRGQHVFLFRGEIFEMSPQLHPHAFAMTRLTPALVFLLGPNSGFEVRIQLPFETPGESVPEPDALICTTDQFSRKPHPNRGLLVIEVADSSLKLDRDKALDYAAAQVPEYWIVDLNARLVEVYRNPVADPTAELGFRYPPPKLVRADESIELSFKPGSRFAVSQLFPVA
jgi:Uma2 family endonuclease